MIIKNQLRSEQLIPGENYIIAIDWNYTNDFRNDQEYLVYGKFLRLEYIRGRTHSYDSGLQVLLSPSRINTIFRIDGQCCKISSVNKFYKIQKPLEVDILKECLLRTLPFDNYIRKKIRDML